MEIEEIYTGTHLDGTKFRIRRINDMWYYAVQINDSYGGWIWHTLYRTPSKLDIVNKVTNDFKARKALKELIELQEGGVL